MNSEHFKVIARHELAVGHIRTVVPLHGDILLVVGDQALQHSVLVTQVAIHGVGEVIVVVATVRIEVARSIACIVQTHQLFGMAYRQTAQQSLVEQREHGGIRPDAERQGDYGDQGEDRRFAQLTKSELEFLQHG